MIKKVRYLDTTLVTAAACLQFQLFRCESKSLVGFAGWSAWIMSSIRRRYAWRILQLLAVHRRSRSWYERCHRFRTFSPEFLFVCFKKGVLCISCCTCLCPRPSFTITFQPKANHCCFHFESAPRYSFGSARVYRPSRRGCPVDPASSTAIAWTIAIHKFSLPFKAGIRRIA